MLLYNFGTILKWFFMQLYPIMAGKRVSVNVTLKFIGIHFCSDCRLLFRLSKKTEHLCSVWFFLFSHFLPIESSFRQKVFLRYWRYRLPEFKSKKNILPPIIFCKVLGVWKLPKWPCSGLNYARFEEFFRIVQSVTRFLIMRGHLSRTTKSF